MEDKNWYYVPPYKNEGHKILNSKGELVADFEMKADALLTVKLHNSYITKK